MAPEVRAARRASGVGDDAPPVVSQTQLTGVSLAHVVDEMGSADRIDILGVLPRVLGELLLETSDASPPNSAADRFAYLTPSRERVLAYRHEHVMGRVIQRWHTGLVCFRNWTDRWSAAVKGQRRYQNIYYIDDLFLECVVVCRKSRLRARVFTLTLLPQPHQAQAPQLPPRESLVVTEVADDISVDSVLDRVDALRAGSRPSVSRRLVCAKPAERRSTSGLLPDDFLPHLVDIRSYGSAVPPGSTVPVAVVALYSQSPRGPGLLLKHRTPLNSRNDLDTLSLVSERVEEEDLALAVACDVPQHVPDNEVLDHWWKTLGKPTRMEVPHAAFVAAAQREVFVATGLDLATDRFSYCGSLVLEREGSREYLGFLGFRVVLRRDREIDELARALTWSPDLKFVRIGDLYETPAGDVKDRSDLPPLNRLLARRPDWVTGVLLADPDGDGR